MKPLTSSSSFALRVVVSLGLVALSSGSFLSSVAGQDDQHKIDIRLKGLPKQNRAVYLGWQGKIDTKISFSQFFDSDHTVMAWFMPQYPHCYEGPIFAENGSGNYIVGQGHYRDGDGGYKDKGNPVFFIQVGDRKVIYLVPEFKENSWVHVAVVRLNNKFKLYLNGTHKTPVKMPNKAECQKISNLIAALKKEKDSLSLDLKEAAPGQKPQIVSQINALNAKITAKENELEQCLTPNPDDEIEVSANFDSKPYGTLRFGRRTTGNSDSKRDWQAYGLLDDVAVFSRALSSAEINAVRDRKRLTGTEHGLIAGWCFDKPDNHPEGLHHIIEARRT